MEVTVSRHAHFNAAHRLHVASWSLERNTQVFGKCANPKYHGHNYELIVSVRGAVDPITGFVVDLSWLSVLINKEVEERLDHKNLNEEVAEFKTLNPTAENIAMVIWQWLQPHFNENQKLKVTLYETPRNFVEFSG